MIEFQNVSFKYHYEQFSLFENVSFTLCNGVNIVLCDVMSGKTTLCKMILGLQKPDSGKILVDGRDIYAEKFTADALLLPSKPVFFQNKTVAYNLQYPFRIRKQKASEQQLQGLASRLGLSDVLNKKVRTLSPCQQKSLAIARGLTVPRKIVLFDGFFNNTCEGFDWSMEDVIDLFPCQTKVVLTSKPSLAQGNTVVLDGKTCVFQGNAEQAKEAVQCLPWLSEKLQNL